jgi:hypothetical protein
MCVSFSLGMTAYGRPQPINRPPNSHSKLGSPRLSGEKNRITYHRLLGHHGVSALRQAFYELQDVRGEARRVEARHSFIEWHGI